MKFQGSFARSQVLVQFFKYASFLLRQNLARFANRAEDRLDEASRECKSRWLSLPKPTLSTIRIGTSERSVASFKTQKQIAFLLAQRRAFFYTVAMFEVRVETEFAAAHFLQDYHGKCENLHGHNYRVFAHARGEDLDGGGMLLDFGELKKALRAVCATLDHTNLNDLTEDGKSVFNQNPSAERIARHIFTKLRELLPTAPLYAVDVYETPTSRARYIG